MAQAADRITVGVVGAGQLARMMIPAAINLGIELKVLAEAPQMSADLAAVAVGDYRDADTVLEFAKTVDVLTFDHEHVPQPVLQQLVAAGHRVHPGPAALLYAQDKLLMRQKLQELGVPLPSWTQVRSAAELDAFIADHGGSAVVKTPRGGYDGKGVRVVSAAAEVADWFAQAGADGLLVEEKVAFCRELSQLIARRPSGQVAVWSVVETVQTAGVCDTVLAPAVAAGKREFTAAGVACAADALTCAATQQLQQRALEIAQTIAAGLEVTGVLAVEMFETADGRLLVNELAMRPHNSGHFSIEGSVTSQFEQHLRAVADLPLGSGAMRDSYAVMVNVLGGPVNGRMPLAYARVLAAVPQAKIHSYGKDPRPGRKVGHVTVVDSDLAAAFAAAKQAAAYFQGEV